jgi:hypothetical protein
MQNTVKMPRVKGAKWLTNASYIPEATKALVARTVRDQISRFGSSSLIEVRPHSYSPGCELLVVVTVAGRRIGAY